MRDETGGITAYYRLGVERSRLSANARGRLEFLRVRELLRPLLPPPPARVLDVGGATGAHARWLAADGHAVTVVDVLSEHVEVARGDGLDARVGDARDLADADASADAVLLMGPLYHLVERADRLRALGEARRVLRPGGLLAAVVITRHSALLALGARGGLDRPTVAAIRPTFRHGRHDGRVSFTDAHFHTADEAVAELREAGLADVAVRAVEGPLWPVVQVAGDGPAGDALLDSALAAARVTEDDPALFAASTHLLVSGHRPTA
jgi:SAM-dependent methyltransferase